MVTVGNSGGQTKPLDILVVDDEPQMADLVGTYLERTDESLQVSTATSANEGLEELDDEVDCVISDYHMPQMDGLRFLDRVGERVPDTVRILYTSDDDPDVMVAARETGADYVHKEVSTEQYAAMAAHIRRRAAAEET
jgi:DNA-binding response OmpR family regulator